MAQIARSLKPGRLMTFAKFDLLPRQPKNMHGRKVSAWMLKTMLG
jgi:hypothetical protein